MALTELQELGLREQLETEGLSEVDELRIREALDSGTVPAVPAPQAESEGGFLDTALGTIEAGTSLVTGAGAEVLAGFGGLAKTITSGPQAGQETIEQIREAFTFKPRGESGKGQLESVGGFLQPVGEALQTAETFLGDAVFEATDSPALAAAAATMPTAILELLGFKGAQKLTKLGGKSKETARDARKIRSIAKKLEADNAKKTATQLIQAAPSIRELKNASGALYKEVDNLGATIKPEAFNSLTTDARKFAVERGLDPELTPNATQVLKRLDEVKGQTLTTTELDTLRKVAQSAPPNISNADRAINARVVSMIDDLLEDTKSLNVPDGVNPRDISLRLKSARKLVGQQKRSEIINEAFIRADFAPSFEDAIRIEFRSILKNKNKRKAFNASEQAAMKRVANGDKTINLLRFFGQFGISLEKPTFLGPAIGVAGGAESAGLLGSIIPMAVGTPSKFLAKKLTARNADFADALIRSGRDATKITQAYLKEIKKGRVPDDLATLLLKSTPESLAELPRSPFIDEAVKIVISQKRALAESGAAAAGAAGARSKQEDAVGVE